METFALVSWVTGEVLAVGYGPEIPKRSFAMVISTEPKTHLALARNHKKGHFVRLKPHTSTAKVIYDGGDYTLHEKPAVNLKSPKAVI